MEGGLRGGPKRVMTEGMALVHSAHARSADGVIKHNNLILSNHAESNVISGIRENGIYLPAMTFRNYIACYCASLV